MLAALLPRSRSLRAFSQHNERTGRARKVVIVHVETNEATHAHLPLWDNCAGRLACLSSSMRGVGRRVASPRAQQNCDCSTAILRRIWNKLSMSNSQAGQESANGAGERTTGLHWTNNSEKTTERDRHMDTSCLACHSASRAAGTSSSASQAPSQTV